MSGGYYSVETIVKQLIAKATRQGECLICHLACSIDRHGRARPYVNVGGRKGKKWGVPRLVLHTLNGPLGDDEWALYSCDNPQCIEINHLFKGDAKDNTDDMIAKGRKVDDLTVGERRRRNT